MKAKTWVYFVSFAHQTAEGLSGFGMGEYGLQAPITTLAHVQEVARDIVTLSQQPGHEPLAWANVLFYQLLRTE